MYNRYQDIDKFITDVNELRMDKDGGVYISNEEDYGIMVDLEEQMDKFEELKPQIVFVAKHIGELDNMVQRYSRKRWNETLEDYVALVYIDEPNIVTLEYWGARVNTQYLVEFEYTDNQFVLKSFGMNKDIPADWDKEE